MLKRQVFSLSAHYCQILITYDLHKRLMKYPFKKVVGFKFHFRAMEPSLLVSGTSACP